MSEIQYNNPWDIRIHDLVAGYDSLHVIKSMSTKFPAGKISAILGESGCGKTTLLRIFLGLITPISGKVYISGKDIFDLSPSQFRKMRRRFGVLFQDGALLSSFTLEENVGLPLKEHTTLSKNVIRKSVLDTLDLVGLADVAHLYPNELSGGMRKRAGLARAIITEPPVLFYDEPTSGLDPITSALMDQLLLDMQSYYSNMTTILITHDMTSVKRVADYALVLKDGTSAFSGSVQELFDSTDPYISEFVNKQPQLKPKIPATINNPEVSKALEEWLKS